ncbi:tyrosine-type recombinase/integrase [Paenibacillus gyeongsangnamensis]|uniref:tyrosine-type recombinase/integrase n=1 Tax=Paenibacillus gyeongsangnamensis TaxID=3388067 RepID=UPI00390803E2
MISSCMKEAGIRQGKGERRGPHCLRHSVAARLLAAETPQPIISSILGHANKDTTKIYLSTDLEHLRACALGMNGIEVAKEEWK